MPKFGVAPSNLVEGVLYLSYRSLVDVIIHKEIVSKDDNILAEQR